MKHIFDLFNEVHIKYDHLSGCTFIISLNSRDGVRCSGGTRMRIYPSLDEGVADAIQLTRSMSKKCKMIGAEFNGGFSGGKGVIIGDPASQKSPEMLARYGEFVNALNGVFVTGTDLNINDADAQYMAKVSPYIDGLSIGTIDDTAVGTAYGILYSMQKITDLHFKTNNLEGMRVCVQGLGSVGMNLIDLLIKEGATVIATDISIEKREKAEREFNAVTVSPDDIYDIECDIFSPNAIGGILNEGNIKRLRCKCIIGSANSQLDLQKTGFMCKNDSEGSGIKSESDELLGIDYLLNNKDIIYLPDYLVGIGGIYTSICEQRGKDKGYMLSTLRNILNKQIGQIYHFSLEQDSSFLIVTEQYVVE